MMKSLLALSLFCLLFSCHAISAPLKSVENQADPIGSVQGLIGRILGQSALSKFSLKIIPANAKGLDVFEVETTSSQTVTLRGNTGVSLASALNWYLRYYCNSSVSWGLNGTGNHINLPNPLPSVSPKIRVESPVQYRYYMNVCTVSYSSAWWSWQRWEFELDWMALNGINLPLSFTGQEYVWQQLFLEIGVTNDELEEFFAGPAFLAWGRMGNIRGWGGPITQNWIQQQYELQQKILQRQREFGMIPVLPGFAGHVPKALSRIYPNATITRSPNWGNFPDQYCCVYLLAPVDPLFRILGKKFVEIQTKIYGTDHIYNADTFNEMDPASNDPKYLGASSQAVLQGIRDADPAGIWLMQGWLFQDESFWGPNQIKAYLDAVPNDGLIILDLYSDQNPIWSKTNSYFGKNFIWCMLHNFGGTRGIYGLFDQMISDPLATLSTPGNTMIGTGMTPEAIEQNYIMYELMAEMGWRSQSFDSSAWIQSYATRRYGNSVSASNAWKILHQAAYSFPWSWNMKALTERVPDFRMSVFTDPDATGFAKAWRLFIQSQSEFSQVSGPWKYDAVDFTRQTLNNIFYDLSQQFETAYDSYVYDGHNVTNQIAALRSAMLEVLADLDTLLGSDINYLLGNWIADARSWSNDSDEQNLLEFNAKNQITRWGPNGEIEDYASKSWAGLVGDYYAGRWSIFLDQVLQEVNAGQVFNRDAYLKKLFQFENAWNKDQSSYPTTPTGDTLQILNEIYAKYGQVAANYKKIPGTDAPGNDIVQTWTKDIAQLTVLCNANPKCLGFNSDGYLKLDVSSQSSSTADLYIKTQ